jgi:uncharacterized phiE125 gp8 family phage protein
MSIVVVDPPADPVVSLEEAKAHLRVDHDDDDDYIASLVEVATGTLDGPSGWLGRCLVEQTLEWRGDGFGSCDLRLPYPPVTEVVSVKYDDVAGIEQTVPSPTYRLLGQPSAPRLALVVGAAWPSARNDAESVRVRFTSGWPTETEGEGDDAVVAWTGPAPIRHAILLMVSELYENREAATDAPRTELPFAVTALLSTFRVFA